MANTTNFGWETPDDTDLVKDGAAAMRTLGNAIDTSFVDLKGGTTGQVLSKASNTDLDFTWVAQDDSNAIQNAIVDAKGDLISASAADVPARLAVGNNGETLVADSSATTGLRWQANFAAGKNVLINADFRINQRAFSSTTTDNTYGFDRWKLLSGGGATYSAQTFTAGTAPEAGYEGVNFARIVTTGQSGSGVYSILGQSIEDVRTFANQTITVSFWAKANSGTPKIALDIEQGFGNGGSATVNTAGSTVTLSTSWARYSLTVAVPSISGKTIGTSSYLGLLLWVSAGSTFNTRASSIGIQTNTFDIWGVQAEPGSVATAFETATGTLAGELAACQRYYWRSNGGGPYGVIPGVGYTASTSAATISLPLPVNMRTAPTSIEYSGMAVQDFTDTIYGSLTLIALSTDTTTANHLGITVTKTSSFTAGRGVRFLRNNNTADYIAASAEL